MRTRTGPVWGTTALLAVLATGACGGGGDDGPADGAATPAPTPPPQEAPAEPAPEGDPAATPTPRPRLGGDEFAARLDVICGRAARRASRIRASLGPDATPTERAEIIAELDRSTDRALGEVTRLRPPGERIEAFGAFIAAAREMRALSQQLSGALAAEDQQSVRQVERERDRLDGRRRAAARDLGADVCARPRAL